MAIMGSLVTGMQDAVVAGMRDSRRSAIEVPVSEDVENWAQPIELPRAARAPRQVTQQPR